jgi:hypothetical protein
MVTFERSVFAVFLEAVCLGLGLGSIFRPATEAASIRHGGAHIQAHLVTRAPAASALVRPTHELHGVFDMPPGFGQLDLALYFKVDGILGSFRNGLRAVCFQQLPRIVMDFDFSHGVMLLSFWATVNSSRAAEP